MNAELLLQHFERLSEVPDAIPRLRRFILDLAVRGKLVEQDPNDEPAAELLKRIQAEKARLMKEGAIRKQPELTSISADEQLFNVPRNWGWVRFCEIADFSAGRTPSRNDTSFWNSGAYHWVSIADMKDGGTIVGTKETVSEKAKRQVFGAEPCAAGTMIMSFKLTIGKISRLAIPAFHNEAIISISSHLHALEMWLFKVLPQFSRQGNTKDAIKGATLNRDSIANILIPLPPLAEQHRIVAKVDELMALCDQLEAARAEREKSRDRLVAGSLQRLNQPTDNEEAFHEDARFTFNYLPHLTTRPAHIKQLRQTILNLAVRGRLALQDPADEPAAELLKRIQIERQELIEQGRIRRDKPLAPLQEIKRPFMIPTSWEWVKIGDAALFTEYGTSHQSAHSETGIPVLKMGDIQDGALVLGGQKKVPETIDDLPTLYLKKFDLLYNRTNSAELVGKTGIYLGEDDEYTFASYLIRIRCSRRLTSPFYFNLAMNAPYFRTTQIVPHLKQQCGQANVNGTILKNMAIPLPPLAEQNRIVAKVDELMAKCDQLEAQLATTEADSRRFLEAVLQEALTPVLEKAA